MHEISDQVIVFIILAIVLFIFIGITVMIIIDHKVKIPGYFQYDPFSVSGLPPAYIIISFFILSGLLIIISSLLFVFVVTLIDDFSFSKKTAPTILLDLKEQRATEKKRQFHNVHVIDTAKLEKKPVCFYCHGDFPHSKQRKTRVMLNMHTQFIGCLTCHNDPRKIRQDSLSFAWLNYSGIKVTGPHFGTETNSDNGLLIDTDDYYSKIVAYSKIDGENKLLEIPETNPKAQLFLALRNKLMVAERQSIKRTIHKNITRKARSCSRCHTSKNKSYLPFRQLGFSQQRVSEITGLKIISIVKKYSEVMVPNLFKGEEK